MTRGKAREIGWAVVKQHENGRRHFLSRKFSNRHDAMRAYLDTHSKTYRDLSLLDDVAQDELLSVLWRNQSRRDCVKLKRVVLEEV